MEGKRWEVRPAPGSREPAPWGRTKAKQTAYIQHPARPLKIDTSTRSSSHPSVLSTSQHDTREEKPELHLSLAYGSRPHRPSLLASVLFREEVARG